MGPRISIVGSFFPSWILCGLIGIAVSLLARRLLVRVGIDPYVGPRVLFYLSLAILVTLVLWVTLSRG